MSAIFDLIVAIPTNIARGFEAMTANPAAGFAILGTITVVVVSATIHIGAWRQKGR